MAAAMTRKRTHCFFTQDPVDIRIGAEEKVFKVYPSLLSSNSKVFERALSDSWQTKPKEALNFTFLSVEIFNHYLNWCNLGDLDLIADEINNDPDGDDRCVQLCHVLADIYILADILDDKVLRNAAMDKILECAATGSYRPGDGTIVMAFTNLPETSTLCRFMIDDGLSGVNNDWLKERQSNLPKAYLNALLFGWAKRSIDNNVDFPKPVEVARCTYHEHDEEVLQGEKCSWISASKGTPTKTSPAKLQAKRKRW